MMKSLCVENNQYVFTKITEMAFNFLDFTAVTLRKWLSELLPVSHLRSVELNGSSVQVFFHHGSSLSQKKLI